MSKVDDRQNEIEKYAAKLLLLARDITTVRFRFFDTALSGIRLKSKPGLAGFTTDGSYIYYDAAYLLRIYMDEPNIAVRLYLHMLLHCIFFHQYQYDKLNKKYWDYAADIAVENIILEMNMPEASLSRDGEALDRLHLIKRWVPALTAEKIYREFMINNPSSDMEQEYRRLFTIDFHDGWNDTAESQDEIIITKEQWEKISERVKTDLKAFSKDKSGSESLETNIEEATRERYNYRDILERFAVTGEEVTVNDDEFDYIYYTYGLMNYGNMPLIEPLEYKEVNKIREFVIVIDTSASCRGDIVKKFLKQTYEILKSSENFFHHINVRIIQCDAEIQTDTLITDEGGFDEFIKHVKLKGFGTTDFRPPFEYVNNLIDKGEFDNLKGLIYFTDGYGIYPERMPSYDVIFAFLEEDNNRLPVPDWAIKVILEDELYEY